MLQQRSISQGLSPPNSLVKTLSSVDSDCEQTPRHVSVLITDNGLR